MPQVKFTENQSFLKKQLGNLLALIIGLVITFILGEIITRIFIPIFPSTLKLDKDGKQLEISTIQPDTVYRQYSEEFDAITTITKDGYRVPETKGSPDIIFIGDSFTYGQGLTDDETFIMQYCSKAQLSCMNLGVPGSGTIDEIERLEMYLTKYNVHPKKVYLFMMAMTSYLGAGNDLNDNLLLLEKREAKTDKKYEHDYDISAIRRIEGVFFRYSNFARVIKYYLMPAIKHVVIIKPDESRLETALKVAKQQLLRLDQLSKEYQFAYKIILLYPVQDISRGTYKDTTKYIQEIAPIPIISSAKFLEPNPDQYYFSMDGHFNVKGSKKITELLFSLDK